MIYPHLGLRDWPSRIVPEPEFCDFLADRVTLRREIERLLHALENRPTSDIQLLWSWYGAGKTHTLYYLANQCAETHRKLLPVYTELPRDAKGFFDLYRSTVSKLPLEHVIDAYLSLITRKRGILDSRRQGNTAGCLGRLRWGRPVLTGAPGGGGPGGSIPPDPRAKPRRTRFSRSQAP